MTNLDYIQLMNEERLRCGSAPFYLDERVQQVAEERLQQIFQFGFSHLLPDGTDPKPALCKKYGFDIGTVIDYNGVWLNNMSEGIMMGGFDPAALGIPDEQYPHEPVWNPKIITHHNDSICPLWNCVAHAFGKDPKNGVAYSVTNYGHIKGLT